MRRGQSVILTNVVLPIVLILTLFVWFLTGVYQATGNLPFAAGGGLGGATAVGCALVGPLSAAACSIGGVLAGAGGFLSFGGMEMVSGSGNNVGVQVDVASDIYETSSLPSQILHQPHPDGETIREAVQDYAYCVSVDPTCSADRGTMEQQVASAVDRAVPRRNYKLFLRQDGSTILSLQRGDGFSQGPAVYQLYLPVPGGKRVTVRLLVDGRAGGVTWR